MQETGTTYKAAPVKKVARVLEKIAAGRTPGGVNDIVRSTFIVDTPAHADAVVAGLAKQLPLVDEGYKTTNAGYSDRSLNVKFPNGQLGEVLIMPPQMAAVKDQSHKLYVGERNLPERHPLREVLLQTSRAVYGRVYDSLSPDWKAVVGRPGS
jgi:hypothetical protein